MANHASAEKRNRQRITRTNRNRAAKSDLRSQLKKARAEGASADVVREAVSKLDMLASKGIIPKKRASRVKGRLARSAAAAAAAAAKPAG